MSTSVQQQTQETNPMPEQQPTDLTTPEAVAAGQQVYDRIITGQCTDAVAELNAAYGQKEN